MVVINFNTTMLRLLNTPSQQCTFTLYYSVWSSAVVLYVLLVIFPPWKCSGLQVEHRYNCTPNILVDFALKYDRKLPQNNCEK